MNQSTPNICCSSNILATVHKMAIMTLSIACGWGTNEGTPQKFQMSKWLLPTDQQNTFTAQQVDRLNMTFTITLLFSTNLLRIRLGIPSHTNISVTAVYWQITTQLSHICSYCYILSWTLSILMHTDTEMHRRAQTHSIHSWSRRFKWSRRFSLLKNYAAADQNTI